MAANLGSTSRLSSCLLTGYGLPGFGYLDRAQPAKGSICRHRHARTRTRYIHPFLLIAIATNEKQTKIIDLMKSNQNNIRS